MVTIYETTLFIYFLDYTALVENFRSTDPKKKKEKKRKKKNK